MGLVDSATASSISTDIAWVRALAVLGQHNLLTGPPASRTLALASVAWKICFKTKAHRKNYGTYETTENVNTGYLLFKEFAHMDVAISFSNEYYSLCKYI